MKADNTREGPSALPQPPVLRQLGAISSALARIGGALSTALVLIVLAMTAVGVVARYLLSSPIAGIDEATGFLVVAIVMFGAAEAYRRNDHIRIDILYEHAGRRAVWWLEILAHTGVLVFTLFLLAMSWKTVTFSYAFEAYSSGYLELALWIPQSCLVIGAVLLALMSFSRLVTHLLAPQTHAEPL